ncbi:MAG: hypothetical protein P1S60_20660 [Anaerolineae bacterium]|nr:hypothetical protein [Anaerolineae bacterium]
MKRSSWIKGFIVLFIAGIAIIWMAGHRVTPRQASSLSAPRIYAYKDWQSVGVQIQAGDRIDIRAGGEWLYTPGEYHGPEGHRYYLAPDTYPINAAAGGVLLGKIGEEGRVFVVSKGRTIISDEDGLIFFRINDDILSDNEGYVWIELLVTVNTPVD